MLGICCIDYLHWTLLIGSLQKKPFCTHIFNQFGNVGRTYRRLCGQLICMSMCTKKYHQPQRTNLKLETTLSFEEQVIFLGEGLKISLSMYIQSKLILSLIQEQISLSGWLLFFFSGGWKGRGARQKCVYILTKI